MAFLDIGGPGHFRQGAHAWDMANDSRKLRQMLRKIAAEKIAKHPAEDVRIIWKIIWKVATRNIKVAMSLLYI